jgi:hypothetical protein
MKSRRAIRLSALLVALTVLGAVIALSVGCGGRDTEETTASPTSGIKVTKIAVITPEKAPRRQPTRSAPS